MSAVCQHRAMLVAEGRGNARGFVCPYHHWVYSLNGDLVNAPAMERACGFDKKAVRLPAFKVEVWLGFIFINFDAEAPPLAPRLKAVEAAVANYDLANAEGLSPPMATTPTSCIAARCTTSFPASCAASPRRPRATPASCATTARPIRTSASTRPRRRSCRSSPS
jgi:hypothetical protein